LQGIANVAANVHRSPKASESYRLEQRLMGPVVIAAASLRSCSDSAASSDIRRTLDTDYRPMIHLDPHGRGSAGAGSVKHERMFPSPSPTGDYAKLGRRLVSVFVSNASRPPSRSPYSSLHVFLFVVPSPITSHSSKSAMAPRKVLRRSHRKSRNGCQECKRRHIKVCDSIMSAGTCMCSGSIRE